MLHFDFDILNASISCCVHGPRALLGSQKAEDVQQKHLAIYASFRENTREAHRWSPEAHDLLFIFSFLRVRLAFCGFKVCCAPSENLSREEHHTLQDV